MCSYLPQLPHDLSAWRLAGTGEAYRIWEVVRPAFDAANIYLWPLIGASSYARPREVLLSNGFAYVTPTRGEKWANRRFRQFNCHVSHSGVLIIRLLTGLMQYRMNLRTAAPRRTAYTLSYE